MTNTGKFIRSKRMGLNITQVDVGKHLNYTSQFVANWERGASNPPLHIIKDLCKLLKISKKDIKEVLQKDYDSQIESFFKG